MYMSKTETKRNKRRHITLSLIYKEKEQKNRESHLFNVKEKRVGYKGRLIGP